MPLRSECGAPSGDETYSFFYRPTEALAEALAAALRHELRAFPAQPISIAVDHWIPEEVRWSSDKLAKPPDPGWGDAVIEGTLRGLPF